MSRLLTMFLVSALLAEGCFLDEKFQGQAVRHDMSSSPVDDMAAMAMREMSVPSASSDMTSILDMKPSPPTDMAKAIGQFVIFGGDTSGGGRVTSTWQYDGTAWIQNTNGTINRSNTAAAYDSARKKIVFFGGDDGGTGGPLNDTWEYDGSTWLRTIAPNNPKSPGVRGNHMMVYDSGREIMVLYGGTNLSGWLTDTWEYDGVSWTQNTNANGPSRAGAGMVYDSRRAKVVLFGGDTSGGVGGGPLLMNGTWEYDGQTWKNKIAENDPNSPTQRNNVAMVYDSARGKTVLFSGADTKGNLPPDTWEYDGTSWTQRTLAAPAGRSLAAVAYDNLRGTTVLFSGCTSTMCPTNDTWEYDGSSWTPKSLTPEADARFFCGAAFMAQ
jgi:hypothetical protein